MYTFTKEERLCNRKLIEELFHKGSSFLCYPFRISWLPISSPQPYPVQVLFSVSKKRYKKAVERNLVKRRMRESYRLHKQQFLLDPLTELNAAVVCAIGYVGKEITDYHFMEKKLIKALQQLSEQASK